MKTLRLFFLIALLGITTISCRKTKEEAQQDVVEDMNDALEPVDDKVKQVAPSTRENKSEDDLIQEEINKIQDSISNHP